MRCIICGGTSFSIRVCDFNEPREIQIKNSKYGKPSINISSNIDVFLKKKLKINKHKIHLSLSDENKYSIAFVIISKIK